jgi:hypothetical protein
MCFGSTSAPQLPPTPAPTPMPTPIGDAVNTEGQRADKIKKMKQGMLSTIKTSPAGVMGAGSDLSQNPGSRTLGGN